jgi:hypothetical protein
LDQGFSGRQLDPVARLQLEAGKRLIWR